MSKRHSPRKGSLQFWPRKRARRHYARIRSWDTEPGLQGFAGYKAGMTHLALTDSRPASFTKGETIIWPATIVDCPPLKVYAARYYKIIDNNMGLVAETINKNQVKELHRKIKPSKKEGSVPEDFDVARLVVYTQPRLIGIKKKPDLFELQINCAKEEVIGIVKGYMDKDVKVSDVIKEGQFVDIHSVTKGKGFQGTVKRYGVAIMQHKAEKKKRGIASLGPWTPKKVLWTVPQPGKMGHHMRTEYNKLALKIGTKPEEVNAKGGFKRYGMVQGEYLLLKGSVAGPAKRLVIMTRPIRHKQPQPLDITYIKK